LVGYSEDVKGYRIIPLKSKNFIIRRDVKFTKNISAYEPSSVDVPPLPISYTSKNISSLDDESEDDNPLPHLFRILLQLFSFQNASVLLGMHQVLFPLIL